MRLLITGASGFVGYHLIAAAQTRGLEVVAGVRAGSKTDHLDVRTVVLDYGDFSRLVVALADGEYDYIIHAAGATSAPNPEAYELANAGVTETLAAAAVKALPSLKKFVFLSSLAAVGPLSDPGGVIIEQTQPNPVTAYGRSKLLAESRLAIQPLPWLVLRPTAIYGPRETGIFIFLRLVAQGWEPYIGHVAQRLSFVYVSDVSELAVQALFSDVAGRAYNVTDGSAYDRYVLADMVKAHFHRRTLKFHVPLPLVRALASMSEAFAGRRTPALNRDKLRELTAACWVCDIGAAKRDLGYRPAFDLQAGLGRTLDWYQKEGWL